jgi:hypothetical protein
LKHKTNKAPAKCDLPPIPVGTMVLVKRPSLWSGCTGIVEKYNEETTLHYLEIAGKNGAKFHAEATSRDLEIIQPEAVDFRKEMGL